MKNAVMFAMMVRLFHCLCPIIGLCSLLVGFVHSAETVVFGTTSGYDVGGRDPVCWASAVNGTAPDPARGGEGSDVGHITIDILNEALFAGVASSRPRLLHVCPPGASVSVSPVNADWDGGDFILAGNDYAFTVNVSAPSDLTISASRIRMGELLNTSVHVRLWMCDSERFGFCHPLWDTRVNDYGLRPFHTDVGASSEDEVVPGEDRYEYQEGVPLRGQFTQDDGIIYTRWVRWPLRLVESEGSQGSVVLHNTTIRVNGSAGTSDLYDASVDLYDASVEITIRLPKGMSDGSYSLIADAVLLFEAGGNVLQRVDVAGSLPNKKRVLKRPPTILTVSRATKILMGVSIGVVGSFELAMLGYIVFHRNHPVMRLAQGSFLALLVFCCFLTTLFSFTYMPTRDIFCRVRGPLALIPLTACGSTLVGRIWRVYCTLSGALFLGRSGGSQDSDNPKFDFESLFVGCLTCMARLPFGWPRAKRSSSSLRKTVTATETSSLIFILTLPQIALQLFAAFYYQRELDLELDASGDTGRVVCENTGQWTVTLGIALAGLVHALAVAVAWVSRHLPTAFNGKNKIFRGATVSCILAFLSLTLIRMTDHPTTSPDITVYLRSIMSIGTSLVLVIVIVLPRILRVKNGEKVVMSSVLAANYGAGSLISSLQRPSTVNIDPNGSSPSTQQSSQNTTTGQRITLGRNEPLPRIIETQAFALERLLQGVSNKCSEGRSLTAADWKAMCAEVGKFHTDLCRVDITWSDEEITEEIIERESGKL